MYEVRLIQYASKAEPTRERFALKNYDEFIKEIEKLCWKYRENFVTDRELFAQIFEIEKRKLFHVELWRKNKHNEIWRGIGDYYFIYEKNLETELRALIFKN